MVDSLYEKVAQFDISKPRNQALTDRFFQDLDNLLTPIRKITGADSISKADLLAILPVGKWEKEQKNLAKFIQNAEYEPALLMTQALLFHAKIAQFHALQCLEKRLLKLDPISVESYLPTVSCDLDHFGKTGELVGEVWLSPYSSRSKNVTYTVNDQVIPNQNGIGHWSRTFQDPGRQKLEVQCIVKNPPTGELHPYTQEIDLIVKP